MEPAVLAHGLQDAPEAVVQEEGGEEEDDELSRAAVVESLDQVVGSRVEELSAKLVHHVLSLALLLLVTCDIVDVIRLRFFFS